MAATYYHVTPAGAGDFSGSTWANAMGYSQWETSAEALTTETDIYYFVAGGTYTLTSDFLVAGDAGITLPNYVIGVKSTTTNEGVAIVYSDWATGTDRPLITGGTNAFDVDNNWVVKNIRMTGSDVRCFGFGLANVIENCKAENSGAATRVAFTMDARTTVINCEAVSTNGVGIEVGPSDCSIMYCNIHDSATGISLGANNDVRILFNIIDTCLVGIDGTNDAISHIIAHNTIYNDSKADAGSIGIDVGTGGYGFVVTNNIITGFETGINFADTSYNVGHFDYNNIYDCTTDRVAGMPTGNHDVDVDPGFVDAPNGNFAITGAI